MLSSTSCSPLIIKKEKKTIHVVFSTWWCTVLMGRGEWQHVTACQLQTPLWMLSLISGLVFPKYRVLGFINDLMDEVRFSGFYSKPDSKYLNSLSFLLVCFHDRYSCGSNHQIHFWISRRHLSSFQKYQIEVT